MIDSVGNRGERKSGREEKEAKEFMGKRNTNSDHNIVKQKQLDGIFRKC